MYRVLFLSDDWANKKPLKSGLLESGFAVTPVTTAEFLQERYAPPQTLDVVIVDLERSATETGKLCHAVKRERVLQELPMILLMT
ncbi:MAG: hypothetical protein HY599_04865, partial [Candidatus Omnitrophica bacterium]|nr:hypothetical protein [Candidatus Omnitrophota bacterium]